MAYYPPWTEAQRLEHSATMKEYWRRRKASLVRPDSATEDFTPAEERWLAAFRREPDA